MTDSGTYELTMILGAATLMLWGVRMARTGVMRVYGAEIRRILPKTLQNPLVALIAGAGSATILQSSIAVAVFTSSLAAMGIIPVADGLLLMLGADAGSAVVAALLTLNLKALWPVLMFSGYILHAIYNDTNSPVKQFGRIFLGLAMILIALTFMGQVSRGLAESALIRIIISSLGDELLLALLLFALLTWIAHSSIAILLFWASLVQAGITDNHALIVAALLGINLGNSIPPIIMSMNQEAPARRIVAAHAAIKLSGVVACFLLLRFIAPLHALIPGLPGFRVVILHILFNLGLIVVFSPLAHKIARFFARFYANAARPGETVGPRYIPDLNAEPGTVGMLPVTALCREILRIQGAIQAMLEATLEMLLSDRAEKIAEVLQMEEKVNLLFKAVRSYAVEIIRHGLDDGDQKKVSILLRYTASLENSGDIICKTMIGIPETMKKDGNQFSEEGREELTRMFRYLIGSTELAAELIMSWRPSTAKSLILRKRDLKMTCQESSQRHIDRLSQGVAGAMQSSSAHLDLTMNIRWISTQISSLAYDILPDTESPGDDGPEN